MPDTAASWTEIGTKASYFTALRTVQGATTATATAAVTAAMPSPRRVPWETHQAATGSASRASDVGRTRSETPSSSPAAAARRGVGSRPSTTR